jgi:hypothetical protein
MRFVTWNVGHQTRRKDLPVRYATGLSGLNADVIVLTEYVHDPRHDDFLAALGSAGYTTRVSTSVPKQNQVLMASRRPMRAGNIECCDVSEATRPNWLHSTIDGIDVVGFRVPMFTSVPRGQRRSYWDWLGMALDSAKGRATVLLGDLNAATTYRPLKAVVAKGWALATPADGWSFRGKRGHTSAIDHGLVSSHMRVSGAEYIPSWKSCSFAGGLESYSDHAVLRFDANPI